MKNYFTQTTKALFLAVILFASVAYVAAWTQPYANPADYSTDPEDNYIDGPINVSSTGQLKDAGLGVKKLILGDGNSTTSTFDGSTLGVKDAVPSGISLYVDGTIRSRSLGHTTSADVPICVDTNGTLVSC